jgi:energy-converting hydrogenase Eha subunit F
MGDFMKYSHSKAMAVFYKIVLMTLNKLLNYKQKYNIMNKIITLSIATIFLATSYASYSQNIEKHRNKNRKQHTCTL